MKLSQLRPDAFTLSLLGTVALATVLPCRGGFAGVMEQVTTAAIMLLFFLHGAKLSRDAILQGLGAWRLHLMVFASTFVMFPILGLLLRMTPAGALDPAVAQGVLFLCLLPSTVQSSIAFTSIAGGNVPAAVCSASASSLIGILLTPLLAGVLMNAHGRGGNELQAIESVAGELLAPFIIGHLSRPLLARWLSRHKSLTGIVDRGSILLVVYTAFSAAVVQGLWRKLSGVDLVQVFVVDAALLAVALIATTFASRSMRFSKPDEITIVFCGSKKSLASGVPMAGVLFPAAKVGFLIVPLMVFHQIQLIVCGILARRYAEAAKRRPPGLIDVMEAAQP